MNPADLWNLSCDEFNRWRQTNDLPILLKFFKENLPYFEEWLKEYQICDDDFVKAPHSSKWLQSDTNLSFFEYSDNGETKYIICSDFDKKFDFLAKHHEIIKSREVKFMPYLEWGKKRTKKDKFISTQENNPEALSNTLGYGSWIGMSPLPTQALLLKRHPVLKLGQVSLEYNYLQGRNLDFVDIDHLTVSGSSINSLSANITFSSCRYVTYKNASVAFVNFSECSIDNFSIIDSKIQDFKFHSSYLNNFHCENSKINGLTISYCDFDRSQIEVKELERFVFKPKNENRHEYLSRTYRQIRIAFQRIGQRHEAQNFHYLERCEERKALWSPYFGLHHRSEFPKSVYGGTFIGLFHLWIEKRYSLKKILSLAVALGVFYLKIWFIPKYAVITIRYKASYILSLLSYLLWGYSLKPQRLIGWSGIIIASYAFFYYQSGPTEQAILNSLYFSTVTFSTLGFGDIAPGKDVSKLITASEALLGMTMMGLLIGSIAKKSDY